MPSEVQLVTGPALCGKTKRLLQQYCRRLSWSSSNNSLDNHRECCWLTPNQTASTGLQQSLLQVATEALLRPNIGTFSRFAENLITHSYRRIRPITLSQKRRLIEQAIQSVAARRMLNHFANVAQTPGFVVQVDEFIAELKRKDIWPEDFQQRAGSDPRRLELARIYVDYQQLLHRGELYDTEGRFWAAREILAESAAASQQPFDLVVVNGFNDFTVAQYDILRLLGECSSQLIISLTIEDCGAPTKLGKSSLAFAKTSHTLALLQKNFPQLQIESLPPAPPSENSLRKFQQQLLRDQPPSETSDSCFQDVEIVAGNSATGEIEVLAKRIKTLLHSQRAQPEEIVVVCHGGDSMAELITAIFPDYGIPLTSELRPRLESAPLPRILTALLRLHLDDWPFQTLLEVINNRLLTLFDLELDPSADFAAQPRVALEYWVRAAQLPSGKRALLQQLEYQQNLTATGETDQRGIQAATALNGLRLLDQRLTALPPQATMYTWLQALERLLEQLGSLRPAAAQPDQAWQLLRRGLRGIAQVDAWSLAAENLLTLEEIYDLIQAVAHTQRLPARHDPVGRVRILSAESARKLSVPHLFLAGLTEQAFAVSASTEQSAPIDDAPSLLGNLAEMLPESGDSPTTTATIPLGDGALLFYELLTRATQSLTLSYPALDAKGQPLSPSPLLTEIERSAGPHPIPRTTQLLGEVVSQGTAPLSHGNFRRQAVDQALQGRPSWLAGMVSDPRYTRTGGSILSGIACVAQRSVRDNFSPSEGLLLSKTAQAALAKRFDSQHLWSPSQLEKYAACPFRFFSEQLLHLQPLSELTLSNDARRRGSLLHQVLATIHQDLSQASKEAGPESVAEIDLTQRFLAALETIVRATPLHGLEQSLREIERREIEAWAPSYAEQEASYRQQWQHLDQPPEPTCFEVRFGPSTRSSDQDDPASTPIPFELDLGDEQILLTGQIDRVDVGRVGGLSVFNIIDYKSGQGVRLKLEKVRTGHQLQLPLYALAAEQLQLAGPQAVALATGYWNIQGKGFETAKGGSLHLRELESEALRTSKDWQALQPDLLDQVQALISGIRGGEFPVYNQDEQCTRSCSLSTVCRVAQVRSLEKVWPIPAEASDKTTPSVEGNDGQSQ